MAIGGERERVGERETDNDVGQVEKESENKSL